MSTEKNLSTTSQAQPVAEQTSARPVVAPAVDIYENEHEYLVLADLPGVSNDGIHIRFEKGELSLYARRDDNQAAQGEPHLADYRRLFQIPETVDSEKIDAKLQHGVLHLVLPKASKARPRQIAVRAG
jgi:HSP20 family molecular chaperone IbpA